MLTDKPRVTFTVSQDTLDKIDDYRFRNKSKNQTQAILSLIEKGLSDYEKENPSDSDESEPEGTEKWFIELLVRAGYLTERQETSIDVVRVCAHWCNIGCNSYSELILRITPL